MIEVPVFTPLTYQSTTPVEPPVNLKPTLTYVSAVKLVKSAASP